MIYLDNSATTNPKPLRVVNSVKNGIRYYSYNSGRGGYKESVNTSEKIFNVREKIADLFGTQSQNVIFTNNCTLAVNIAVKGLIKKGDHVIISSLEHNAVSRPIETLALRGIITYDVFSYSYNCDEIIKNIISLIKPNTRLIVCTQASNVFGCRLPIEKIGEITKNNGIYFIIDGAQGAGVVDIKEETSNFDAYCSAGHKGLYGPMGTGFLTLKEGIIPDTVIEGGTGSSSLNLTQPDFLPDRLESGTLNNSGIIGLGAGIDFVNSYGIDKIYNHEIKLINYIYDELNKIPDVTLYTPSPEKFDTVPIVSFNYKDYSSEKTASLLAEKSIAVRAGLHCAPLAHRFFNTENRGTVRISPSVFTNERHVEYFLNTLKKLN